MFETIKKILNYEHYKQHYYYKDINLNKALWLLQLLNEVLVGGPFI